MHKIAASLSTLKIDNLCTQLRGGNPCRSKPEILQCHGQQCGRNWSQMWLCNAPCVAIVEGYSEMTKTPEEGRTRIGAQGLELWRGFGASEWRKESSSPVMSSSSSTTSSILGRRSGKESTHVSASFSICTISSSTL